MKGISQTYEFHPSSTQTYKQPILSSIMFKLVVLSAFLAVAAARPELLSVPLLKTAIVQEPGHLEVHESTLAKVGDVVQSVPTAVSHQSSTVVHSRANQITPVVAPAIRTYSTPVVKTYAAPVLESAPVLKTYAAPAAAAIPSYFRSYDGGLGAYGYAYANGVPHLYSSLHGYAGGALIRSF